MCLKARILVSALALFLAAGCAATGSPPPHDFQARSDLEIRSIALQPLVFRGSEPDIFCPSDVEQNLAYHVRRVLEDKGYQVAKVERPPRPYSGQPDPLAREDAATVLDRTAIPADGVMVVWVDELKETGFCSEDQFQSLEIAATAALYDRDGRQEVWRGSGRVYDLRFRDPAFGATARLAQKIFRTLPPAGR